MCSSDLEAQAVVREAQGEARRLLDEARVAEQAVRQEAAEVERQFQGYVAGFRVLLERQLAELRTLDGNRTS